MSNNKRVNTADIQVGEALPWDVYGDNGSLLLRKGHVISSQGQLERLLADGLFVDGAQLKREGGGKARSDQAEEAPPEPTSVVVQLSSARQHLERALVRYLSEPEAFVGNIDSAAQLIHESTRFNSDVCVAVVILLHAGRYSVTHALHTAILTQVVGRSLSLPDGDLSAAVRAALTMNLGMLEIQDGLQRQSTPLTVEQKDILLHHPERGVERLRGAGVADDAWLNTVLLHHEQTDGGGYPFGRQGDDIPLMARLVHMADLYSARVSMRSYRPSVHPSVALRDLFLDRGKQVDPGLANHFVKVLGVYPCGTLVLLTSGEVAIVSSQGAKSNTPYVHALIGPRGAPLAFPIKRDTSLDIYTVREVVDRSKFSVPISMPAIWGKVAAMS